MSKLAGKIAVVTGGSAGIGRGIATHFVREGARVFITGRNQAGLDKAVAEIGGPIISAVRVDASNLADIDHIYQTVREKAGRIDVLVVNAGFYEVGTFGEITEEHFDKTFNTNVRGVLFAVQKALPLLGRGSSVILIGSVASIKGFPSFSVYDATKAAVRSFARNWTLDLKERKTRSKSVLCFKLLTDFTLLDQMDIEVEDYIKKTMDFFNKEGVTEIFRVVPTPEQDFGFNILSFFHYSREVKMLTLKSRQEAEERLRI